MNIIFSETAKENSDIQESVGNLLRSVITLETNHNMPIVIFQDGVSGTYYIKCSILAELAAPLCDLNAKLDYNNPESFRANRELLTSNKTYQKMAADAKAGREFNDIIVEYNIDYDADKPLKVWGGQHRINAIQTSGLPVNRYHGFRIYFGLTSKQRTEVALISNTNISVSNDTFDRMIEETTYGDKLRKWCQLVGLLNQSDDFPDAGSRSEKITVKLARSFVVNYYLGLEKGSSLSIDQLDKNVYEPHIAITGTAIDPKYDKIMNSIDILNDEKLLRAGTCFSILHSEQYKATTENPKAENRKAFRNKALVESVLCGWSYVAGLLQSHPERLENHYTLPRTNNKVPDPLNAKEMSDFKHDSDSATYRGLGTRSSLKDRQRIAQLFLAKSREKNVVIDKAFMFKAVSQVAGIIYSSQGYA
jgi:hypothetical protein